MPHCHDVRDKVSPPERRREGWRPFLLVALALSASVVAASVLAYALLPPPRPVNLPEGATVYYNEACSDCATYLAGDLLPTLAASGIAPVVVKDYINEPAYRQELRALNDALGIPFELQSHLATFLRAERILVFEGHVPGSLVREAVQLPGTDVDRLLIHQDAMDGAVAYGAWAFAGEPRHYVLGTPLSEYVTWFRASGGAGEATSPAILPLVLVAGFVDGLNPCAFAVLLFFLSFLYATRRPRAEVGRVGALYVYAVFLAYLLIGLGLFRAVTLTEDPHFIARLSGLLVAALGAFVAVQPYLPRIPNPFHMPRVAWDRIRARIVQGTTPGAAVAGFLVGLCTFPCSGGIYVAVLGLLAAQTSYWGGLGYLYLYNVAFVLPLVLVLLAVSNRHLARRITAWERARTHRIQQLSGVAMVLVGLLTIVLA